MTSNADRRLLAEAACPVCEQIGQWLVNHLQLTYQCPSCECEVSQLEMLVHGPHRLDEALLCRPTAVS